MPPLSRGRPDGSIWRQYAALRKEPKVLNVVTATCLGSEPGGKRNQGAGSRSGFLGCGEEGGTDRQTWQRD